MPPYTPTAKLTALVITYNEKGYIERCIDSILFADEIIVVDSYSTDGTYEFLCQHPRVKVLQRPFENFTDQKSFTLKQASNNWVLFLDADEVVPKALRSEILDTINDPNAQEAYWFYRKFMFKTKHLRFSGCQTDKNHRLFKKNHVKFTKTRLVHETLEVNGTSGTLKERLTHYCYKNYNDYMGKMRHYANLKAQELYQKNKSFSYIKLTVKPSWKFFYNFIVRLGFLDLERGLIVCYLHAMSVYWRYLFLKRIEYKKELEPQLPKEAILSQET